MVLLLFSRHSGLKDLLQDSTPITPSTGKGLTKLISGFSTPGGFPSHINAQCPGSIHEGGELGYALSVAWGAVMDQPDLIVTCIVGDGESETGPTATAWHAAKYIDPKESGAVIPIVHVNGFKISERTIYGLWMIERWLLCFLDMDIKFDLLRIWRILMLISLLLWNGH